MTADSPVQVLPPEMVLGSVRAGGSGRYPKRPPIPTALQRRVARRRDFPGFAGLGGHVAVGFGAMHDRIGYPLGR